MEAVKINRHSIPISGEIAVPGSKSYSNRILLAAALTHGDSAISGVLDSDDTYAMIETLRSLGI